MRVDEYAALDASAIASRVCCWRRRGHAAGGGGGGAGGDRAGRARPGSNRRDVRGRRRARRRFGRPASRRSLRDQGHRSGVRGACVRERQPPRAGPGGGGGQQLCDAGAPVGGDPCGPQRDAGVLDVDGDVDAPARRDAQSVEARVFDQRLIRWCRCGGRRRRRPTRPGIRYRRLDARSRRLVRRGRPASLARTGVRRPLEAESGQGMAQQTRRSAAACATPPASSTASRFRSPATRSSRGGRQSRGRRGWGASPGGCGSPGRTVACTTQWRSTPRWPPRWSASP